MISYLVLLRKEVLSEEEKGFNQTILYGRMLLLKIYYLYSQTLSNDLGGNCKKEAQDLKSYHRQAGELCR
jgi:hypothetical protein